MAKKKTTQFEPPTLEAVEAYRELHGLAVAPVEFYNYYQSNGWRVGRKPMKDWGLAMRNWERRSARWDREFATRIEKQIAAMGLDLSPMEIPTLEAVETYINAMGLPVDAGQFFDYYEARGWRKGMYKMQDWQAEARNWARRQMQWEQEKAQRRAVEDARFNRRYPKTFEERLTDGSLYNAIKAGFAEG